MSTIVAEEIPAGLVDGDNRVFTLQHEPVPASLKVYRGGLRMRRSLGGFREGDILVNAGAGDYSLDLSTPGVACLVFAVAPEPGAVLLADYEWGELPPFVLP